MTKLIFFSTYRACLNKFILCSLIVKNNVLDHIYFSTLVFANKEENILTIMSYK